MFSFATSKFNITDAIEPSGFATPPIHSPVSGTGVAEGTGVGVDEGVGTAVGTALGAAQAARQSTSRRVIERRPIQGSIFQAVLILTTLGRGIRDPAKRKVRELQTAQRLE